MRKSAFVLLACLIGVVAFRASPAGAGPIDPREINLVVQSWVVDLEIAAINGFHGTDSSVLCYGADIGPSGWSGTLVGTYLGRTVAVDYVGDMVWTSDTTADITFSSSGLWGDGVWSGGGVLHCVDPEAGVVVSGTNIGVSISGRAGVFSLTGSLQKDWLKKELTASVSAGVLDVPYLGSAVEFGAGFRLDQTTGKDESFVSISVLWGLAQAERTVDRTRIFTPPPNVPPPVVPPPVHWPDVTYPDPPTGSTPGFSTTDPNAHGYEHMYVSNNVPEPCALALATVGLGPLWYVHRRRRRA